MTYVINITKTVARASAHTKRRQKNSIKIKQNTTLFHFLIINHYCDLYFIFTLDVRLSLFSLTLASKDMQDIKIEPEVAISSGMAELTGNEGGLQAQQPEETRLKDKNFNTIKWLHFGAAVFFLIQTIAYGAVEANINITPTVGFPIYCNDTLAACPGTFDSQPFMKKLETTNPIWLIPFFTALASFDHFVSYFFCLRYVELTKLWLFDIQSNPFRWIEYCISASVMALAISILCGISDVHIWFLIFFGHFVGIVLGLLIEIMPADEYDINKVPIAGTKIQQIRGLSFLSIKKIIFFLSSMSIFVPWMVMICYFLVSIKNGDGVPSFVYAAFFGTLLLFATFAINCYLNKIVGKYDFATAEIIYISLSFTAKTFLAADVFGGLRASDSSD
jgi:hypothetical protein